MAYEIFKQREFLDTYWKETPNIGILNNRSNTNPVGHKIVVNNSTYGITYSDNQWRVTKYENNVTTCWSIYQGYTQYCCGVWQLGSFYCGFDIPPEVEDLLIKLIASAARYVFNKGVLQAYFYRYNRKNSKYNHIRILNALIRNGFVENSPETFNPNSGNLIKGLVRPVEPPKTKRATRAMLEQRLTRLRELINGNA